MPKIEVPWKKAVTSSFCCGPHYLLMVGFLGLLEALAIFVAARSGWSLDRLAFITMWLCFIACYWYLDFVWRLSISSGKNEAFFKDGTVIVRRKVYRDPRLSASIVFVGLYAAHLMLTVHIYVQRNEMDPALEVFAHPLVNGVFLALLMVIAAFIFFIHRRYLEVIVFSPEGISLQNSGEIKRELAWDDAVGVRLFDSDSGSNAMRSRLEFELRPSNESTRDKWWVPLFPSVQFDVRGFDTEPNAIFRASKECLEFPESRAVLGTPEGVDFVTYGPSWHEVYKMKGGEKWES